MNCLNVDDFFYGECKMINIDGCKFFLFLRLLNKMNGYINLMELIFYYNYNI